MSEKIGILGGTFDPPHYGHLIMAQDALEAFGLDSVCLMPSGHSYFKDARKVKVSSAQDRLRMTQLAAEGNPGFTVSDMEVLRPGNSYTCETLAALKEASPETEYYYIVGADTIAAMHTWYHPEEIFDKCTVIVAARGDEVDEGGMQEAVRGLEKAFHARILRLPVRNIEISSTDLRERVREGKSLRYLAPPAVEAYIREKRLYLEEETPDTSRE